MSSIDSKDSASTRHPSVRRTIHVRKAELQDAAIIADFNSRLAWETEEKRLDPETIAAGVRGLLEQPHQGRYFLAEIDGIVVGQIMHTREWSDWRNGEIWWLQSVYVDAPYRRCGVFRTLFAHLRELAESSPHVVGLRLYVEDHNQHAQQVYEQLGLHRAGYTVMENIFRNKV